MEAVRLLLLVGLFSGLLVSWKLWLTDRVFPHLPCFEWLGPISQPWDKIFFVVYLLVIVACIFRPTCRWALGSVLGISVYLALQDQVRWQPWFYVYLLLLAGFLHLPGRRWEGTGTAVLGLVRLILVGMYFWSGYHKLHPAFDTMFAETFVGGLGERWPDWAIWFLERSQGIAPGLEILTAFLLLLPVPVLRQAGVLMAVGTHLFILLLVGPLGMNNNEVIWSWNICMLLVVPLAFWQIPSFGWRELAVTPVRYLSGAVLILVGIMPAFSPGDWDRYLSFHLYTGRGQRVMVVLNEQAVETLPEEVRPFLRPGASAGLHELRFKEWAYQELRVPFPTEERLNLRLAKKFAALPYPVGSTVFFYYDYEFERDERGWDKFSPGEMLKLEELGEPRREDPKQ